MKHREAMAHIILDHPRILEECKSGEFDFGRMRAEHQEYERDA